MCYEKKEIKVGGPAKRDRRLINSPLDRGHLLNTKARGNIRSESALEKAMALRTVFTSAPITPVVIDFAQATSGARTLTTAI